MSSYLALHRATLTMPVMSPPPRWALTPPFHPCLSRSDQMGSHRLGHRRFDFCGAGVGLLRLGVTQRPTHGVRTFLPMLKSTERPSSLPPTQNQYTKGYRWKQEAGWALFTIGQWSSGWSQLSSTHFRQEGSGNRSSFLIDSHGLRHPTLQLVNSGLMTGMGG